MQTAVGVEQSMMLFLFMYCRLDAKMIVSVNKKVSHRTSTWKNRCICHRIYKTLGHWSLWENKYQMFH